MTLVKGWTKIPIRKRTDERIQHVKRQMAKIEPDKYDETTTYDSVVSWMVDKLRDSKIVQ